MNKKQLVDLLNKYPDDALIIIEDTKLSELNNLSNEQIDYCKNTNKITLYGY